MFAAFVVFIFLLFMLLGGWDWDDMRSVLLHRAWNSFTYEGELIPGKRPGLVPQLVIKALSREDEARKSLVAVAMGAADESNLHNAAAGCEQQPHM